MMKQMMKILSFSLVFVMFFVACRDKNEVKPPVVETSVVTDITSTSATCGGEVIDDGGADMVTKGICWSLEAQPTTEANVTVNTTEGDGPFVSVMTALQPATTYYVRAYAINSKGTSYGVQRVFTTLEDVVQGVPEVTTDTVLDITTHSAKCKANVVADGGFVVNERGLCWGMSEMPTIEDNHLQLGEGLGEYEGELTELTSNATYYVRAYAINDKGIAYGAALVFSTLEEVVVGAPEVNTDTIIDITTTTALCKATIISDGGAAVTARGICWSITEAPSIEGSHTIEGEGQGSFQSLLVDLTPNTTYFVRAYATNDNGTK